jgi:hypothetical protein
MVICWLGTRAVYDSSCQLDSSCFAVLIIVIIVISCRYCWLVISPEPGVDHLPCELFVQSVFMDWPTNPLTHTINCWEFIGVVPPAACQLGG